MFETAQNYEARAYTFQGLKSEERKYRVRNFKRCQGNKFCEQTLEQGGRKWIISSHGSKEEEVLKPSPSSRSSYRETALISSSDKRRPSGSRSQSPTIVALEQLDREQGRKGVQTLTSISKIAQRSVKGPRAMRPNYEGLANLSEPNPPAVAAGSATASCPTRAINGQETPILSLPYDEEESGGSPFGARKQKSKEQLERRKERKRRAQQVRQMMKFDEQDLELQPRVFMHREKSEVRRLLHKQELTLHSAHKAELDKKELTLHSAYQAKLQEQKLALRSAHQAELQEQERVLSWAHQAALQTQWRLLHSAYQAKFGKQESAHREVLREQSLKFEKLKLESLAHEQAANKEHRNRVNITIDL